jgi:hypothetical protein
MNQPSKPEEPPKQGAGPTTPDESATPGIPAGAENSEPKGTPNADRHKTETTPKR